MKEERTKKKKEKEKKKTQQKEIAVRHANDQKEIKE